MLGLFLFGCVIIERCRPNKDITRRTRRSPYTRTPLLSYNQTSFPLFPRPQIHSNLVRNGHSRRRCIQVGHDRLGSGHLANIDCSYSLTVFSPSGKLVQIEHALAAVSQGTTSLGIKGPFRSSSQETNQTLKNVQRQTASSLRQRRSHLQSSSTTLCSRKSP